MSKDTIEPIKAKQSISFEYVITVIALLVALYFFGYYFPQITSTDSLGKTSISAQSPSPADSAKESQKRTSTKPTDNEVLLQTVKSIKDFDEALYIKQTDTIKIVLYVIGFFSVVAFVFGYRTLKDIRDKAKEEMETYARFYNTILENLSKQTNISTEFYEKQYNNIRQSLKEELNRYVDDRIESGKKEATSASRLKDRYQVVNEPGKSADEV